jgi:hypothetical protein
MNLNKVSVCISSDLYLGRNLNSLSCNKMLSTEGSSEVCSGGSGVPEAVHTGLQKQTVKNSGIL